MTEQQQQTFDEMRGFLGKYVQVTLDWNDPTAKVRGTLHGLAESGEVIVRLDDGFLNYAWPCLQVDEVPDDAPQHRDEVAVLPGVRMIYAERHRQILDEAFTPEHDAEHDNDALAMASICYALPPRRRSQSVALGEAPWDWPWEGRFWKPSPDDRVRELVKAGALIAAEIDRLTCDK